MPKLQSRLQIGIAIGAAVLIIGALAFMGWRAFGKSQDSNKQAVDIAKLNQASPDDPDAPKPVDIEEVAATGTITGSLTYPSEYIPEIEIFAENIDTGQVYSTKEHINDSRYKYGVGYKISVLAGNYYVYGVLPDVKDQRGYYNNAAKCLLDDVPFGSCVDEDMRIVVNVEANQETDDTIIADWTATCVIPGGKQPTKKFDLPTC